MFRLSIECGFGSGDRFNLAMPWLGVLLLLLFLLPLNSFAQAHLWKFRPFRTNDTGHSGGDHICDLRRDSNEDGVPDRLGDYVTVSGIVIAEPSTFETGGWLFWVRDEGCGIMAYGRQEALELGDSVRIQGWLRSTNGDCFFPETGLATLGDISIENGGVSLKGTSNGYAPIPIPPQSFCARPQAYGGNLITLAGLSLAATTYDENGDVFAWFHNGPDSLVVYLDRDTGCASDPDSGECYQITGIVTRMRIPQGFAPSPSWCLAPRATEDLIRQGPSTEVVPILLGSLKAGYLGQD
jgi:hypothetical protein